MGDLNISRGNPSLTDSVRLELLLIFGPFMALLIDLFWLCPTGLVKF